MSVRVCEGVGGYLCVSVRVCVSVGLHPAATARSTVQTSVFAMHVDGSSASKGCPSIAFIIDVLPARPSPTSISLAQFHGLEPPRRASTRAEDGGGAGVVMHST